MKVLIQAQKGDRERDFYDERSLVYPGKRLGTHPLPYAYGYIIGTLADDGGCLDCHVITDDLLERGAIPIAHFCVNMQGTLSRRLQL